MFSRSQKTTHSSYSTKNIQDSILTLFRYLRIHWFIVFKMVNEGTVSKNYYLIYLFIFLYHIET